MPKGSGFDFLKGGGKLSLPNSIPPIGDGVETFAKRPLLPPAIGGMSGSNFNPPEAD